MSRILHGRGRIRSIPLGEAAEGRRRGIARLNCRLSLRRRPWPFALSRGGPKTGQHWRLASGTSPPRFFWPLAGARQNAPATTRHVTQQRDVREVVVGRIVREQQARTHFGDHAEANHPDCTRVCHEQRPPRPSGQAARNLRQRCMRGPRCRRPLRWPARDGTTGGALRA